uniref:Uncharacterized protein n=1 Tax=Romanomermis culicivorax TaxID=13658 RepID=A0A915ILU9_ROMCU
MIQFSFNFRTSSKMLAIDVQIIDQQVRLCYGSMYLERLKLILLHGIK